MTTDTDRSGRADAPTGRALTREHVLDALDELARVEHALCVEHLLVYCALGHDLEPFDGSETARRVALAAQAAFSVARIEMSNLHRVNRGLVVGRRAPQLDPATSIGPASGEDIRFGPLGTAALEGVVGRERALAAAVEARYARLVPVTESPDPSIEPELLDELGLILALCADHTGPLAPFESQLAGVAPSAFVRVARRDPANDFERRLLELSDRHYAGVVATVRAWFAHEDDGGSSLRSPALAAMELLNAVNGLLAQAGLLPTFTSPARSGTA